MSKKSRKRKRRNRRLIVAADLNSTPVPVAILEDVQEAPANQSITANFTLVIRPALVPEQPPSVPTLATFLLLLIPIRDRKNLAGDLEEEFHTKVVPRYGLRWARVYYYWQVAFELATALTRGIPGAFRRL
jgi:hypothetical protein